MLGVRISIHALREEGDGKLYCGECGRLIFLSTPSARRATRGRAGGAPPEAISIHALREEGNRALTGTSAVVSKFLSTPSARRATRLGEALRARNGFLSTPSARRATRWHKQTPDAPNDFYPRPPRGGRRGRMQRRVRRAGISIHALREEGDRGTGQLQANERGGFLSTPSARRATADNRKLAKGKIISIHALREEGDNFRT